ncbi:THUMP-like domain-containing protein [Salininema proteolyticum]|uniref:SAM-dependent methyltransferase n=1 Tax=Salininema proteolyticum TaxID=1607685 RepID=A0ABV8TXY6_9ACTN
MRVSDETWERLADDAELRTAAASAWAAEGHRASTVLRRRWDDPALVAAAVGLAELRERARSKFGARAEAMYFTRAGLEQATRWPVALRHGERLARFADEATDLCAGLGTESLALASAGLRVRAVERDPLTAWMARRNAEAWGLGDRIEVVEGDALEAEVRGAGFADPARRDGAGRKFDPEAYLPPLSAVAERFRGRPAALKLGPGIDREWADALGGEAEWVSVGGAVVEACLWSGGAAEFRRRASLWDGESWQEMASDEVPPAPFSGEGGEFLLEPDGAVIRSELVGRLAGELGAHVGHESIAYLYAPRRVESPWVQQWRIVGELPFKAKALAKELRRRDVGRLTIKQRGTGVDPQALRRQLKLKGGGEAVVVLTRVGERHVAWEVEEV